MKKTTCNNLGGACDEVITGETTGEMGQNSKNHVMQKIQAGDEAHKKSYGRYDGLKPRSSTKMV